MLVKGTPNIMNRLLSSFIVNFGYRRPIHIFLFCDNISTNVSFFIKIPMQLKDMLMRMHNFYPFCTFQTHVHIITPY